MTAVDLTVFAVVATLSLLVPVIVGRQRLGRWAVVEVAYWIVAVVTYSAIRTLSIEIPGSLIFAVGYVSRIAMFVGFVFTTDRRILRWGPLAAGVSSLVVYALLVPHFLQWPIDGDEPHFVLIAESVLRDGDLDLRNQYANLEESVTRRGDLGPQMGDPTGADGKLLSRHEPFLSVLLIPGLAVGGLPGAALVICLLGGALVYSTLKLLDEWGCGELSSTLIWPVIAFTPPVFFYSLRIWSEVPGALALSESLRAMRSRRWVVFLAWLAVLSLLQLRFAVIAAGLVALAIWRERPRARTVVAALAVLGLPFMVLWIMTGSPTGIHRGFELLPAEGIAYLRGAAGLLIDAQNGLLFQAPLLLLALVSVWTMRKRDLDGDSVRGLWLVFVPYLLLLLPRAEWHGGWSPPLRYLVVFAPLFAIVLARSFRAWPPALASAGVLWSVGLVIHGIAFPWRLFSMADGQSTLGEWASMVLQSDLSRLLPSLVRPNFAVFVWGAALVAIIAAARMGLARPGPVPVAIGAALAVLAGAAALWVPPRIVHFEDAHVLHEGGELHPERWTEARFRFRGGWAMGEGASASFRLRTGPATIHYASAEGAAIEIDGRSWVLPPTEGYGRVTIEVEDERVDLGLTRGSAIFDRIQHD